MICFSAGAAIARRGRESATTQRSAEESEFPKFAVGADDPVGQENPDAHPEPDPSEEAENAIPKKTVCGLSQLRLITCFQVKIQWIQIT